MAGDRTLKLSLLADTKNLLDGLKKGEQSSQTFGDKIDGINRKVGLAFAAMGAAAAAMAVKFTKDAIGAASDLEETVSKIGVIFGDTASEIDKFANTAAKNLGQSKQQALDAAANFAIFGKAAGLSGQALVDFSVDFVALASDLASFNNTTPEDAIMAIGAALRGEAEPLRRYGVLLNDATLKAAAMELGIYNGTGALTAQQKVLAAQKVIMEQTADAQGDFTRTSDGLANSQRQIEAAVKDAQAQLGTALLPVMLELANFTEETLIPALTSFIAGLTGQGGLAEGLTNTQKSAEQWGKRLRGVIDVVIELKDVAIVTAGVLTTMFVVSKIQAAVVVTVNLIKGLVAAYNALRVSAMAAGIAAAFALNPALGIAAGAAAIAGMGLIIKQLEGQNKEFSGVKILDDPGLLARAANAASTSSTSIPVIPSGGGIPSISSSTGTTTTKSATSKTTNVQTTQSSDWRAPMEGFFDPYNQQFSEPIPIAPAVEENVAVPVTQVVINVNSPSIIDENGFSAAVVNALNRTNARTGGGGTQLAI